MNTTERAISDLQRVLDATAKGHAVCPPLQRALLARIAAELKQKQNTERLLADSERLLAELQSRAAPPSASARKRIVTG